MTTRDVDRVRCAIAALLPDGIEVEAGVPGEGVDSLRPEEAEHVARVLPARRNEFATGRHLARKTLARLGAPNGALLPAKDRAPCWPEGIVGSIAHTRELCAVVAARREAVASLGLDLEVENGVAPELRDRILVPFELEWLESFDQSDRAALAAVVFSAKECFYKCQYPLTRRLLDFRDVVLELDPQSQRFRARPSIDLGLSAALRFEGGWAIAQGHVITAMALASPDGAIR
jgi:4'-phosphopantetheinyl transferase EntD